MTIDGSSWAPGEEWEEVFSYRSVDHPYTSRAFRESDFITGKDIVRRHAIQLQ